MNNRAMWLILPSVGLVFAAGCGGPPPEPPAVRAPISVAKPAKVPSTEKKPLASIATSRDAKPSLGDGQAPRGKTTDVAITGTGTAAHGVAGEFPRVRLAHVRPIPMTETADSKTPTGPTAFMVDPLSLIRDPARLCSGGTSAPKPELSEATRVRVASEPDSEPQVASRPSVALDPPNASSSSTLTIHGNAATLSDAPQRPVAARPKLVAQPIAEAHSPPAEIRVESERIDRAQPDRTPQLMAVCQRAEALNRHGFELAQRGAIFSARLEYMQSLEMIAEALDAQRATHAHQRMLAAGFKAIEEADDFTSHNILSGGELNVAEIVRSHQTTVLKDELKQDYSAMGAMGRYLTYAQEQLATAVGDVPQASAALFGLGKVYSVPPAAHGPPDATGGAKAVVFHQAALMVDGRNFMAANELGVLLVRFGRLPEARAALLHSLSISPQPVVWQNLAEVHQAMAEYDLAAKARQSAEIATNRMGRDGTLAAYDVQWVDPATFVRAKPIDADPIKATPTPTPATESKSVAGSVLWGAARK